MELESSHCRNIILTLYHTIWGMSFKVIPKMRWHFLSDSFVWGAERVAFIIGVKLGKKKVLWELISLFWEVRGQELLVLGFRKDL